MAHIEFLIVSSTDKNFTIIDSALSCKQLAHGTDSEMRVAYDKYRAIAESKGTIVKKIGFGNYEGGRWYTYFRAKNYKDDVIEVRAVWDK